MNLDGLSEIFKDSIYHHLDQPITQCGSRFHLFSGRDCLVKKIIFQLYGRVENRIRMARGVCWWLYWLQLLLKQLATTRHNSAVFISLAIHFYGLI